MNRTAEGKAWVRSLPALVEECFRRWGLVLDVSPGFPVLHGYSGIVLPVLAQGREAVLKVSLPVEETLSEGPALRHWQGHGAVRLLDDDPAHCALLLERLSPVRTLWDVPLNEAAWIWGGIVRQLSEVPVAGSPVSTDHSYRIPRLSDLAERWCDELPQDWMDLGRPFPAWLLHEALEVCQTHGAVARRDDSDVLVHQDLHFRNILARPGPDGGADWVAIDPQAVLGPAEFSLPPVLRNRIAEYGAADPVAAVNGRLKDFCAEAGLDTELARQWSVVSFVEDALWFAARPGHEGETQRSLWLASALSGRVLDDSVDPTRLHDPGLDD
ncbi:MULTISPECIES: aminoglycoside phosphotransferase family protein [Arthrobacter]|uniref:Aminoglycoside phosphotransferase family protein n=2 Tax=Arthrobacter TaxID=1663 RepID=A0ABU9KML8_9MICC|nr:aminoglycoside phosphotransferase family protein [Arthrobacter sp. YJM1]MDP5227819.1 aminoglycoside phosphotransferase family protein [Arthrobacter sp. YJM1]